VRPVKPAVAWAAAPDEVDAGAEGVVAVPLPDVDPELVGAVVVAPPDVAGALALPPSVEDGTDGVLVRVTPTAAHSC